MTKKALVVAIDNYAQRQQTLMAPESEAARWIALFETKYGFERPNVRPLLGSRATRSAITERLNWLLTGASAGDRLVFAFLGHGVRLRRRINGVLSNEIDEAIVAFPDVPGDVEQYAVYDDELESILSEARVPETANLTFILDCCYAGGISPTENARAAREAAEAALAAGMPMPRPGARNRELVAAGSRSRSYPDELESLFAAEAGAATGNGVVMAAGVPIDIAHRLTAGPAVPRRFGQVGGILPTDHEPVIFAAAEELGTTIEIDLDGVRRSLFSAHALSALEENPRLTCQQLIRAVSSKAREFAVQPVVRGPENRLALPFLS